MLMGPPGCPGCGDGNPPIGSLSAPRHKERETPDGNGAGSKTKARGGKPGGKTVGM
jgi:hypothetical protein